MKVQELRKKLKEQGLATSGEKEELVARYTAFRSFLLSAKDAGLVYTQQRAAKEFAKRSIHSSSEALAGGGGGLEAAAAGAGAMAAVLGAAAAAAGVAEGAAGGREAAEVAAGYSHRDLIREARRRMKHQKKQQAAAAPPGAAEAAVGGGGGQAAAGVEGAGAAALPPLPPELQRQPQQEAVHMTSNAAGVGGALDEAGVHNTCLDTHPPAQALQQQVVQSWPAGTDHDHYQPLQPQQEQEQQPQLQQQAMGAVAQPPAAALGATGMWEEAEQGGPRSTVCMKPLQAAGAAGLPLQELRNSQA
jgi:hypothetical protein